VLFVIISPWGVALRWVLRGWVTCVTWGTYLVGRTRWAFVAVRWGGWGAGCECVSLPGQ
jgi:hypothetical protein